MAWKCPPLSLMNWSNFWKWNTEMNAYELADVLKNEYWNGNPLATNKIRQESATMLRQQADRIAELEKFIKAILKKGGCDGNICKRYDTHPVKQLSDEEIAIIWANYKVPMTGMEFKEVVQAIIKASYG